MLPPIRERYEQLTLIRTTNLDTVYHAYDRLERRWVALKRITAPLDGLEFASRPLGDVPELVMRLALMRELHRLAGLRHPYLIPVLDYGVDELGVPYFTGNLIKDAQPLLVAAQTASFADKVVLLANMLDGLTYLHRHHILHRGLRPETVLVSHKRALLCDAGLTILLDPGASSERATLLDTIAYIAPEILRGASPSDASDLYAVGLLAYQMFVGRHPLPQVHESILRGHVAADTPTKNQINRNVQQVITAVLYEAPDIQRLIDTLKGGQATEERWRLIDVIRRMLAKSPDDRVSSAAARAMLTPGSIEMAGIGGATAYVPHLVEREAEINRLDEALNGLQTQGSGSAWLISGKGGAGKTILLDDFQVRAQAAGVTVARGRADTEGAQPFHPLRAALPTLILQASNLPDEVYSTFKLLLPTLEEFTQRPIANAPPLQGKAAEARTTAAVETLLRGLTRPAVILLEEIQWSEESLALFARLSEGIKDLPVLLIMAWREIASSGGRRQPPLPVPTLQGVTSMQLEALPAAVFPEGFEPEIANRLARIPTPAWELLQAAAAAGRTLDPALLEWINPMQRVDSWLEICAEAGVIRIANQQWVFVHERLRDQILTRIIPAQHQEIYRQIAQGLTTLYGEGIDQSGKLAYHWGRAGDLVQEAHYVALAGLEAYAVGALALARRRLARAQEIAAAGQLEPVLRQHVEQALAHLIAEGSA